MDIQKTLQEASDSGQIDALIAAMDPADLAGAIIRSGNFFDVMKEAGQRATSGNCRADGPSGGLFFRHIEFDAPGDSEVLHTHHQPHCALVMRGKAMVRKWDKDPRREKEAKKLSEDIVEAGARVDVPNDVYHEFLCIEAPYFHHCIFPLVDRFTGKVKYKWDGDIKPYC